VSYLRTTHWKLVVAAGVACAIAERMSLDSSSHRGLDVTVKWIPLNPWTFAALGVAVLTFIGPVPTSCGAGASPLAVRGAIAARFSAA
jgi:hypothetical protein